MSNEIYHYGVKGMKWGVRRKARKDAKEYASAKMYYGKGAGTRRKLIKAKVEERSKDKFYKEEFDKALNSQNMEKRAAQAKVRRKVTDAKDASVKTGRGLINIATGNAARASASLVAAYGFAKVTGLDRKIIDVGKDFIRRNVRFY